MTPLDRLLSKIAVDENNCWLYLGATSNFGYGYFWLHGKNVYAHRASWELHRGPITGGMNVLHTCDVTGCINPDHLWLGTHQENTNDMIAKGRRVQLRGLARGNTVISEQTARIIKQRLISGDCTKVDIARGLRVSYDIVKSIDYGNAWRWLDVN